MDSKRLLDKLKGIAQGKTLMTLGLAAVLGGGTVIGVKSYRSAGLSKAVSHSDASSYFSFSKWMQTYGQAFISVQSKVDELRHASEQRDQLRLENANLRLKLESMHFDCQTQQAQTETHKTEDKLLGETGSKIGRSLASIHYKPPVHLLPSELFTLGVYYFRTHEDEKAAVIFSFLTGLEENETFKNPKTHLLTGISWYRVDNYELANLYFEKVLGAPETAENLPYQAQARLWKALLSENEGKHNQAQAQLKDLIDHHPHSMEAGWVNSTEANRVPAARE